MSHIDHIKDLIKTKTRRLQILEEQEARQGIATPADVILEIRDLRKELDVLRKELRPEQQESSQSSRMIEVPFNRNKFFTGRQKYLEDLRQNLINHHVQAMFGIGGCGKTQIALEYAYRHFKDSTDYDCVLWMRAGSTELIKNDLAHHLKIEGLQNLEDSRFVRTLTKELNARWKSWLLIFDNVDPSEPIKQLMPSSEAGHILFTSRGDELQSLGIVAPIFVDVMSPEEAVAFLLKRTGRKRERPEIRTIAADLGYLPLALEQAAAFIVELKLSFQEYLDDLAQMQLRLFEMEEHRSHMGDYSESVLTTWTASFKKVRDESDAAADLLELSAFLAPDVISLDTIAKGASQLGPAISNAMAPPVTHFKLKKLIRPLRRFSLINLLDNNKAFTVHRIVQEVIRYNLKPELRNLWIKRKLDFLLSSFASIEDDIWSRRDELINHIETITHHYDEPPINPILAARLFSLAGIYLIYQGQYDWSLEFMGRVEQLTKKFSKELNTTLVEKQIALATIYWFRSEYKQAIPLAEEALEISKAGLQPRNVELYLVNLNTLGILYTDQGRYREAENCFETGLSKGKEILGEHHLLLQILRNNLGWLYKDMEDFHKAEKFFKARLDQDKRKIRESPLNLALTQGNLAYVYFQWDQKIDKAERLLDDALPVLAEHSDLAQKYYGLALNTLGNIRRVQKRYEEAQEALNQALQVQRTAFGNYHMDVAITRWSLAEAFLAQGLFGKAYKNSLQALAIRKRILSEPHPKIVKCLRQLARIKSASGDGRLADCFRQQAEEMEDKHRNKEQAAMA